MIERMEAIKNQNLQTEPEDLELVGQVQNGNRAAFSMLVKRHQKTILRISLRFMKDLSLAEDVTQEAFIKAFEKIKSFEGRASFKSWLIQIAVNGCKNKLRDRRGSLQSNIDDVPLAVGPRAEFGLLRGAVADLIQKYVDQLPLKQKTALVLRVYEDLSFKEIAVIMKCPYDTAKANYRHALIKLREELSEHSDLRHWTEEVGGFFIEKQYEIAEVET